MNIARGGRADTKKIVNAIDKIADLYESYTSKKSSDSAVLEIGFGGRPHCAFALQLRFRDVTAVDLDHPVFGWADFPSARRKNGLMPAWKALVRSMIFDRGEWQHFHASLKNIDYRYAPDRSRLVVADVGEGTFWENNPGPFDLVYSVDVFEHIPELSLIQAMRQVRQRLSPKGLLITIPCVFTGIVGGHDPYWYPHRVEDNDSRTAWGHLPPSEFKVDTYVNRLSRGRYVEIFHECGFEILEDVALHGRLGERHLTPGRRRELPAVLDDYELFSNNVRFVLRIRK